MLAGAAAVPAQETALVKAQPRPFKEVKAEWDQFDGKIEELIKKYRGANDEERKEIVKEYESLSARSRKLLPLLRESALSAYKAAPNRDKDVTETLVGLLANDVRQDQFERAFAVGKLLIDNKCDEQAVFGLVGTAAYSLDDFKTAEQYLTQAKESKALSAQASGYLDDLEKAKQGWAQEQAIRKKEAKSNDLPRVKLQTGKGDIVVELLENEAPLAVANFVSLVDKQFYDGLTFHRVLPGFMAQAGCPDGTGSGGPGYRIPCECHGENYRKHFRGSLSMAHAGLDTGGSQFFLTFRRTAHLDGKHTVFGRVIEGMDVLAQIQRRDPSRAGAPAPDRIVKAEMIRKRAHAYVPTKVE